MIFSLFRRKKSNQRVIIRQYEAITEAARHPVFYSHWDVPDTVMGRFEMISLHLVLYFRNSRRAGDVAAKLAQEIVENFFQDVDHSIRELGVGDAVIPKRMKKLGKMFYGRAKSYEEALNKADKPALNEALRRNIHPKLADNAPAMDRLTDFIFHADQELAAVGDKNFVDGTVTFPTPELPREK